MGKRKIIIAGNWKMYKNNTEALQLIEVIKRNTFDVTDVGIIICPAFTALSDANDALMDSNVKLGAQNAHFEDEGAFTGAISPGMLKHIGCKYVIIGHSERRKIFQESDGLINKKLKKVLQSDLTPIFCIGETLEEREAEKTFEVIERQIKLGLEGIPEDDVVKMLVAYEPVWAIGTGKTATPSQAQKVHAFIRKYLASNVGSKCQDMTILYGGSVKPANIKDLVSQEDIDGGLVGGASLEPESFVEIIKKSRV